MSLSIHRTDDGVCEYPIHTHDAHEIMIYTEGKGVMRTDYGNLPFDVGTVILMPAGVSHGSCSNAPFCNVSVRGELAYPLSGRVPVLRQDESGEAILLASMLYRNRYGDETYLLHLVNALLTLLPKGNERDGGVTCAVRRLEAAITERASDTSLDLHTLLVSSGYAEDYVRASFKRVTGMTPTAFLARARIDRARHLIDIYGDTLPLSEIAERCGYLDYVYFSKSFHARVGVSPRAYLAREHDKETV